MKPIWQLILKLFRILITLTLLSSCLIHAKGFEDKEALTDFVDNYANIMMKQYGSPSGAVAITQGGELIFAKGYGFQDLKKRIPFDVSSTLLRGASVSKLFTAVAVMQQVELGNLNLDTDVNQYLKNFQIEDSWPGEPITLRHLLTHTAGLESSSGALILEGPEGILPLKDAVKKNQPPRVNPPGKQVSYSNYSSALAGSIVEEVSGVEFKRYIKLNIFNAIGMNNSTFVEPLPEELSKNMAVYYHATRGSFQERPFEILANFAPAGSLTSTAIDMSKFSQMFLNGGTYNGKQILKAESVKQMLERQFSQDERMPGIGLAFYEHYANGHRLIGHGGDLGAFHSEMNIDQTNDLTYFISFASSGGGTVRNNFKGALYDRFFPTSKNLLTPQEGLSDNISKYVGTYKFWRASISTFDKIYELFGNRGIEITPTLNNTLILTSSMLGGSKEYAEVEKNLFREVEPYKKLGNGNNSTIAFQENGRGEITGLITEIIPVMSAYRSKIYEGNAFNHLLLALSCLVFAGVWLNRLYRRSYHQSTPSIDKNVYRASLLTASLNLFTVASGLLILLWMENGITNTFKLWLALPMLAVALSLYQLFHSLRVWRYRLLSGITARLLNTTVTCAAIFMCWFYWHWNLLGFLYVS